MKTEVFGEPPSPVLTPGEALSEFIQIQRRAYTMQKRALERLVWSLDPPPGSDPPPRLWPRSDQDS